MHNQVVNLSCNILYPWQSSITIIYTFLFTPLSFRVVSYCWSYFHLKLSIPLVSLKEMIQLRSKTIASKCEVCLCHGWNKEKKWKVLKCSVTKEKKKPQNFVTFVKIMIWHVDSVGGVQIIKSKQSHFTWKEEKHKLLDQKSGICHIF